MDSEYHFFNLHAIGKTGIFTCDILGDSSLFLRTVNYSRASLKSEFKKKVLELLHANFIRSKGKWCTSLDNTTDPPPGVAPKPEPEFLVFTNWKDDPYACGSYSYVPVGFEQERTDEWRVPESMGTGFKCLHFAGEHTVDNSMGFHCVDGAVTSGILASNYMLKQQPYEDYDTMCEEMSRIYLNRCIGVPRIRSY